VQWVGEQAWTYRRTFTVPEDFLKMQHQLLRCDGLDTLATITVNGHQVARTDNMFRTWEFNVRQWLKPGANSIEVVFDSVLPYIADKEKERHLPTWNYPGSSYVRKTPCNFGWDWGPTLITCGIWKDIALVGYDTARLDNVLITQNHSEPGKVRLAVQVTADPPANPPPLQARITVLDPDGNTCLSSNCNLAAGQGTADFLVPKPRLWWPAGMGDHPLYTVEVVLLDRQGGQLDTTSKRIGLRTLHAIQQTDQAPLHFVVNGVPFFAKGANWVPPDVFPNRITKDMLRRYMTDAVAANMNSLRFWGGGNYEQDELFDLCDELGLCVWLDFKFACTTYPSYDPAFLENVRQEARDNVKRLRHHPSIALWCGNNEIMFFRGQDEWTTNKMSEGDYYRMFRDTLGEVVRADAPGADFVTGSPDCGDVHYWEVWHGGKPFEAYGDMHGFVSEFGFQAWPVPQTVAAFTAPEDRGTVYSKVIKYHMRSNRGYVSAPEDGTIGTDKIMNLVRMYFHEPKDFESTLWLSQITQAYGIEYGVLGWRREMPRSMGSIFWQFNDTWPGTSWSSVDYFGRWKALQYRARDFYSPLLISGVADNQKKTIAIWTVSDRLQPVKGTIRWSITDVAGTLLDSGSEKTGLPAQLSQVAKTLDLSSRLSQQGATNLLVWLSLDAEGKTVSRNLVALVKPKELPLANPNLKTEVSGDGTDWSVTIQAEHPALWTWVTIEGAEARYSDNFIHIAPGIPVRVELKLAQPMDKANLLAALKVRSLYDTYTP
jgi:beta-mannosidase